ncbi:TetR/AcrR family transcriptional regulator [Nonomuraea soli]|uniref:AcrR family transcriptional regulator n=1 Tax=Nonomuraea soli TaxID=1032476 RepID=A0A7W0CUW1_9ACTN|nr:TetR/AcrR family transcriptional regulator [Nonomuraea soli]MBA2897620.1 AcrR family transcriptional regulator [Nonomuraea soli]
MVRLTRAQRQELTRDAVLRAAGHEFAAHGFQDAKIDRIAARADLTRGAVYSNFPSKRALYLAVLLAALEHDTSPGRQSSLAGALGAFVRVWLERLPLAGDPPAAARLRLRSLAGVFEDDLGRSTLAQMARLEGLLLGLALEQFPDVGEPGGHHPRGEEAHGRRVRLAELVLTLLTGACQLAERAPGFGDPFDVIQAARHLAGLGLDDEWAPPYLDFTGAARQVWEAWHAPEGVRDELTGQPVDLEADGVIVVLGTQRLEAAEEAVRAARPGDQVTVVVATADPAELGRLVRLRVGDLAGCLRVLEVGLPLRLVLDEDLAVTSAIRGRTGDGAASTDRPTDADPEPDELETAVRIHDREIIARAEGRGAAHAVAEVRP